MFTVAPNVGGELSFISGDKSKDNLFWTTPSSLISGENPLGDGKKSVIGGAASDETSIIDLEHEEISSDGPSLENKSDPLTNEGTEPFDVTRQLVHQRLARLAEFGYHFMRPVRHNEDRSMVCWNIVEAFSEDTSTHGVSHILNTSGYVKVSFWTLMTVLSIAGVLYNLQAVTSKFLKYPVIVGIEVQHANDLDFPAVTICNVSPLRSSLFDESNIVSPSSTRSKRRRRRSTDDTSSNCCCKCCVVTSWGTPIDGCSSCGEAAPESVCDSTLTSEQTTFTGRQSTTPYTTSSLSPSSTLTSDVSKTSKTTISSENSLEAPPATTQNFKSEQLLTLALSEMSLNERASYGYTVNDMILDCQYAGSTCDPKWFTTFQNSVYGNCFIFNSGWNNSALLRSYRTGRRFGLEMIIDIDQFDYLKASDDTAGIHIVVHSGRNLPFPEDQGLLVSPGYTTSIGIQKNVIQRLGQPFDSCVATSGSEHDFTKNVYEELYPDTYYTSEACSRTCYQRHVITRCQCGDIYYPLNGTAFSIGGKQSWPPCQPTNETQDICRYNVALDFAGNKLECDCPLACEEEIWPTDISLGDWPSDATRIFFEEFNYEQISEQPAYQSTAFMSDVGGSIGLFLGMSIMSCIEFIELFIDLLIYFIIWCYVRRKGVINENVVGIIMNSNAVDGVMDNHGILGSPKTISTPSSKISIDTTLLLSGNDIRHTKTDEFAAYISPAGSARRPNLKLLSPLRARTSSDASDSALPPPPPLSVDRTESVGMEELKSPLPTSRSNRPVGSLPESDKDGGSADLQIAPIKSRPRPAVEADQVHSPPPSYRSLSANESEDRGHRDGGSDDKGPVELNDRTPSQRHIDDSREPGDDQSSPSDRDDEQKTRADKTGNENSVGSSGATKAAQSRGQTSASRRRKSEHHDYQVKPKQLAPKT